MQANEGREEGLVGSRRVPVGGISAGSSVPLLWRLVPCREQCLRTLHFPHPCGVPGAELAGFLPGDGVVPGQEPPVPSGRRAGSRHLS